MWIAPDKIGYLADNRIAVLSVLLPFFGVFRVVRAVYALRSLSLARVVLGANRATQGVSEILGRGRFQYVAAVVIIITIAAIVGAAAVSFFERGRPDSVLGTFSEALWWSATLVTTINIDVNPVTVEGRIIAMVLRIVGLSVFGYLTANIATYLLGIGPAEEAAGAGEPSEPTPTLAAIQSELRALRRELAEERQARGEGKEGVG